jgi:hypothetical protein
MENAIEKKRMKSGFMLSVTDGGALSGKRVIAELLNDEFCHIPQGN